MGETQSISRSKGQVWLVVAIVLLAVLADQALKMYIHSHFVVGESRPITSWFWLCYVENNGMAFGIEWFSKLALTLFRLVAVGLLGWYVHLLIYKYQARTGFIVTIACIIAGALGNLVDCVCYGKLLGYAG
ncbi:MAG: signal peptidase II, partial [Paludibacteraceae bacterium]|nr:signal peptidase II [Paludibacteraceae bacterium]